ncbi:adenylate/guanylate cyclase domain-containing protein [Chitinophaga silvatica]|uniref:Adenylate/guanylate cyclase domain-containing protein n=1 Tax=Chitinophaga silvatica TaxID=2282649 RepID=A0A3E1Y6A9_9BACT|nr:adenylate/guanylate cyclase domain-containing protein [Chitinophaga silvatica]RFS20077.1 adenylate/guanylate cyclase domain-containing protein [Chitinophaga silvatica]
MPNLDLVQKLNCTYHKNSKLSKFKGSLQSIANSNSFWLEKALSSSLAELGPEFTRYFDFGLPAEVALLFIDICNFSTQFSHLNGEEIGEYFDEYYRTVIPIIYKYGGEVDKIIGDGIVCIFGPPFMCEDFADCINAANIAAKEIIEKTIKTKHASKIAFHAGTINYFKNKSGFYNEYTIIGKPLTELFRLESISEANCINYFDDSPIREFYKSPLGNINYWSHFGRLIPPGQLQGISYNQFFRIKYPR